MVRLFFRAVPGGSAEVCEPNKAESNKSRKESREGTLPALRTWSERHAHRQFDSSVNLHSNTSALSRATQREEAASNPFWGCDILQQHRPNELGACKCEETAIGL